MSIHARTSPCSIWREGKRVTDIVGRDPGNEQVTEHARLVIGADGFRMTAGRLGGREFFIEDNLDSYRIFRSVHRIS
ncbi:hypothetical protein [Nocardia salmonicida]|uniref:hypothetical protein n=1 Tax=Nocardia salmonicida TaxID=53431 RepID=UPI00379C720F